MTVRMTTCWAGAVLLLLVGCRGGTDLKDTESLISLRIEGFMKQAGIT